MYKNVFDCYVGDCLARLANDAINAPHPSYHQYQYQLPEVL